jgi:truncated hemoglobin YjbI
MDGREVLEALGGKAGCRAFSRSFYARVGQDPVLRSLFPAHFNCAIEAFSAFLVQFLGGSQEDSERRWFLSLRESHQRLAFGERERLAWMALMRATLAEYRLEPLAELFETASHHVTQPYTAGKPAAILADKWDAQLALDEVVAAIKRADIATVIHLIPKCQRTVLPGLLARMIRSGHASLVEYAQRIIRENPELAAERCAGRTLLHEAAGAGDASTLRLLLEIGADPSALDIGNHTPLYGAANECMRPGGREVVFALVRAGADVNADSGVQRCTPLHMAARRGNVEIAQALLECGAEPAARDRRGDTPAERALKCRQRGVAELLKAWGSAHSLQVF